MRSVCVLVAVALVGAAMAMPMVEEDRFPLHTIARDVNSLKTTWTAHAHSMFDGASYKFLRMLCGSLPEPDHVKLPEKDVEVFENIPDTFDTAENWPQCADTVNTIRDQGGCGSCWAVSSTSTLNDRMCIASNGTDAPELSAEDTLSCCSVIDFCGNGCNGGFPSGAWRYFKGSGLVTGGAYDGSGCYPYQVKPCEHHVKGPLPACSEGGNTPSCHKSCQSSYPKSWEDDKHKASSHYSVSGSVEKIQSEIMAHGSVTATFTVYSDFPTYKSGVYKHTSGSALGGHAVVITGWGVENGTPYWKVRNSWRKEWGANGYFLIQRGNNECGIEGGIVAGLADA